MGVLVENMTYRHIVLIGIAITIAPILGHYLIFGPKRLPGKTKRTVQRFSLWERLIHLMAVVGFLALCITGFWAVIGERGPLRGWLCTIHCATAPVFCVGLCAVVTMWARDAVFSRCDWQWALVFGGYLWGDKHAPAERFNGGQKGYLWVVAALGLAALLSGLGRMAPVFDALGQEILLWVHRGAALLFVMAAIAHFYLGTFANPGTLGAVLLGRVSPEWAEKHHPDWWKDVKEMNTQGSE